MTRGARGARGTCVVCRERLLGQERRRIGFCNHCEDTNAKAPPGTDHASAGRAGGRSLTLREAARLGGLRTRERYGPEYYREIGRKGGERVKRERGPEFYREIGREGGQARKAQVGPGGYAALGKRGGATTKEKYGPDFYAEIGRKGGRTRAKQSRAIETTQPTEAPA